MNNTERFIAQFYQSIGKTQPYQLSIVAISNRLNLNIHYWKYSSAMTQLNGKYRLFINDQLNEQKQWQEFGHEMSHYFRDRGNRFVLRNSFIDYRETKSDYFAYHFCIPTFMLMNLKGFDVYDVMRLFNVEFDFALRRLEMYKHKLINRRSSYVL